MKVAEVKGVILVKFSIEESTGEKLAKTPVQDLKEFARENVKVIINPDFIKDTMVSLEDRNTLTVAILI